MTQDYLSIFERELIQIRPNDFRLEEILMPLCKVTSAVIEDRESGIITRDISVLLNRLMEESEYNFSCDGERQISTFLVQQIPIAGSLYGLKHMRLKEAIEKYYGGYDELKSGVKGITGRTLVIYKKDQELEKYVRQNVKVETKKIARILT